MAFGFLTRSMSVISAADLAIFANVLKSLMHRRVHAIALAPLRSPGLERPAITSFRAQRLQILERVAALQHQGDNLERKVVPRGHDLRLGLDLHVSSLRSSGAARANRRKRKRKASTVPVRCRRRSGMLLFAPISRGRCRSRENLFDRKGRGTYLAARPFTKRFGNVPASSVTCSGDVEVMTIEFPSSPIGASPCEYSLKRRS